jgi:tape measure domain-containing protein
MARQIVGEIFLNVKPLDGGVSTGVQKIIDSANDQAAKVPVTADTEQAEQAVAQLAGSIEDDVGGAWIAATAQAATFTAAIFGLKRAVEGAVGKLAGVFDQLAQAQAGFTAILGTQAAGGQLLDDIREFARVSPFVTQELVTYSQQLLGVGQSAESIVPLLRNTGDLIASVGGDTQNISRVLFTLTQIRSIGRLVGQDAIQLQSALVPITKLLADYLGKTTAEVKKLQQAGSISADTVFDAINNAGQKVEGAMLTATRNIGGAQAVLSDTIEIMLQDSTFLRQVFDDIVVGILSFSDALGEGVVATNLATINASLEKLYASLKPILAGFGSIGASSAVSGLKILASTLEILGSVVDIFPESALEVIGQALGVLLALKAPIALLNYGRSLTLIATAIRPTNLATNLTKVAISEKATGDQAAIATPKVQAYASQVSRTASLASAAAFGIGLFINSIADSNKELKVLGSTLQGAGLGASLGAAFGPQGAVVGALAGGAYSAITGFVTATREAAEARAAEMGEIGKQMAEDFLAQFNLANPLGFRTTAGFEEFFGGLDSIGAVGKEFDDLQVKLRELTTLRDDFALGRGQITQDFKGVDVETQTAFYNDLEVQIKATEERIKEITDAATLSNAEFATALADPQAVEALTGIQNKLGTLGKEIPDFRMRLLEALNPSTLGNVDPNSLLEYATTNIREFQIAIGEATIESADDLSNLQDLLQGVGLTIDDLVNLPLATLITLLDKSVPDSIKSTLGEVIALKTAFDEAKASAEQFFAPLKLGVSNAKELTEQNKALQEGLAKLQETGDGSGFADVLLKNLASIKAANLATFGDEEGSVAASLTFANAQFENLQLQLGLTDEKFQDLLRTTGLLDTFNAAADFDTGFFGTLVNLQDSTGLAIDDLREILGLSEEISATKDRFIIDLQTEQALRQLKVLKDRLADFPADSGLTASVDALEANILQLIGLAGGIRSAGGILNAREQATLDASYGRNPEDVSGLLTGPALQIARENNAAAREEARKAAEEAAKEAERLAKEAASAAEKEAKAQEKFIADLEGAGDTVAAAIQQAADQIEAAAQAWVGSIKERTQQETAVPISRLLRNAGQQGADLTELDQSLKILQGRGLSDAAIAALDINNISDLRQVRKLLAADSSELAQLSRLVGTRDANAEIIARRQQQQETQATIVAAIVQAAGILGVKLTPDQAVALSAQINITGSSTAADLPPGLIDQLLNAGQIVRT